MCDTVRNIRRRHHAYCTVCCGRWPCLPASTLIYYAPVIYCASRLRKRHSRDCAWPLNARTTCPSLATLAASLATSPAAGRPCSDVSNACVYVSLTPLRSPTAVCASAGLNYAFVAEFEEHRSPLRTNETQAWSPNPAHCSLCAAQRVFAAIHKLFPLCAPLLAGGACSCPSLRSHTTGW